MVNLYQQRRSASQMGKQSNKQHNRQNIKGANQNTSKQESISDGKLEDFPIPDVQFDQLYGCDESREEAIDEIEFFKRVIDGSAVRSSYPILVCGSARLGKTSFVQATANYGQLKLVIVPLVSMIMQTRNEFKETLEHLFRHSISNQPVVILIDDLDQIIEKDECKYLIRDFVNRILDDSHNIIVFCTTSSTRKEVSFIYFPWVIQLKRPDMAARFEILKKLCQDKFFSNLNQDCLEYLARSTPSFTAADLGVMLITAGKKSRGLLPTLKHCDKAIEVVRQSFESESHLIGEKPTVTWNDIGGMDEVRREFAKISNQTKRGVGDCKYAGILLYGPPGCGKTMVAQAMANEVGHNFISIKPSELVDKYLGETEKNIRRVFQEAREYEPCILYFDEFDGLCGTRGSNEVTKSVQTFLSELNGFTDRGKSIMLASTNRIEDIDPAMLRPGRLSKHIYVGPPNEQSRLDILSRITSKWKLEKDVDLSRWALKLDEFTGAELDFLVSEADAHSINRTSSLAEADAAYELDQLVLTNEDFLYAYNKLCITNKEIAKRMHPTKRPKVENLNHNFK